MKRKIISIFLVVILFIISSIPVEYAKSAAETKKELESQLNNVQNEKKEITNEKKEVLAEISELDEKIEKHEEDISSLNEEITKLNKSIKTNEKEIKNLEKEYEEKQEAFIERMVILYESGQTTYLDVLLSSDSIVNFISSYYMISEIADADTTMLEMINQQKQKIEDTKNELETKKKEITNVKRQIKEKTEKLNETKSSKQSKVNSLSSQEKKLQKEIEKYQEDIKKVEQEIKAYESNKTQTSSSGNNTGKLGWPVQGYYTITSYFGYRIHPIYGYNKLHTGIDIGAPKNAKFVAAADGVVISASYSGGYGNRVVVSHGNGLSTLYAHGTSILVSAGQKVKKGQAVLTVGSTGLSTGNHAHFEVRVNGDYVDPLKYLK